MGTKSGQYPARICSDRRTLASVGPRQPHRKAYDFFRDSTDRLHTGRVGSEVVGSLALSLRLHKRLVMRDHSDDIHLVFSAIRFNRPAILIGPNLVRDDSDEWNCELRGKLMGSRGGFQRTVVGFRRDQHHVDMPRGATLEMLKTRLHVCDRMLAEIRQL